MHACCFTPVCLPLTNWILHFSQFSTLFVLVESSSSTLSLLVHHRLRELGLKPWRWMQGLGWELVIRWGDSPTSSLQSCPVELCVALRLQPNNPKREKTLYRHMYTWLSVPVQVGTWNYPNLWFQGVWVMPVSPRTGEWLPCSAFFVCREAQEQQVWNVLKMSRTWAGSIYQRNWWAVYPSGGVSLEMGKRFVGIRRSLM